MKYKSKVQSIARRQFFIPGGVSLLGLAVPGLMKVSPNLEGGDQDNGALMSLNFKQDTQHTFKEMLHQALKYARIEGGN